MFIKSLIFVLLVTSFVLANPVNEEVTEQQRVDKNWREKINGFLHKVEDVLEKYYKKGKESLKKVVNILKEKSKEIAETVKEKWVQLNEKYQEIKDKAHKAIQEKKQAFQKKIKEFKQKGMAAAEKLKEYVAKAKDLFKEEYRKFKTHLKEWLQKVKDAIVEARHALQKKSFEEILGDIEEYGDLVENGKEKLAELKNKYFELKKQAIKVVIRTEDTGTEGETRGSEKTDPERYQELKGKVSEILAAVNAKWDSMINGVTEQIQAIIKEIKDKIH